MHYSDFVAEEYDVSSEEEFDIGDWHRVETKEGREKDEEIVIEKGDRIKMHYRLRFVDTTVEHEVKGKVTWIQVDNTKERKEPLEFVVGEGQVIKGLDQAVIGMCLHEKCELMVSAKFGYGKKLGCGRVIPPDTQLHYDIEIVQVNDEGSGIGEYEQEEDELDAILNSNLPEEDKLVSSDSSSDSD